MSPLSAKPRWPQRSVPQGLGFRLPTGQALAGPASRKPWQGRGRAGPERKAGRGGARLSAGTGPEWLRCPLLARSVRLSQGTLTIVSPRVRRVPPCHCGPFQPSRVAVGSPGVFLSRRRFRPSRFKSCRQRRDTVAFSRGASVRGELRGAAAGRPASGVGVGARPAHLPEALSLAHHGGPGSGLGRHLRRREGRGLSGRRR